MKNKTKTLWWAQNINTIKFEEKKTCGGHKNIENIKQ